MSQRLTTIIETADDHYVMLYQTEPSLSVVFEFVDKIASMDKKDLESLIVILLENNAARLKSIQGDQTQKVIKDYDKYLSIYIENNEIRYPDIYYIVSKDEKYIHEYAFKYAETTISMSLKDGSLDLSSLYSDRIDDIKEFKKELIHGLTVNGDMYWSFTKYKEFRNKYKEKCDQVSFLKEDDYIAAYKPK